MEETDRMQCVRELNVTQVLSRIVPEKRRSRKEKKYICCDRSFTAKCCLTPSSSEQKKTSYLMQYLVSNTNMESVSSSKKKRKKYQLSCIYLLDNCKGFLPFHVWILWKQNPLFFFFLNLQSTYCSVLVVWMGAWLNRVTFPVYVKKESVPVCVRWVCVGWFH